MTLIDRLDGGLPRAPVTIELDDIQATVLRYRPEPYYGTHVMLHVQDAQAGREFVRRLAPHVDSAAGWWRAGQTWISVAISYAGLVALGVPQDSLQSFPEAFRAGMAARAGQLLDHGDNDPKHWDAPFGSGLIHLGVSVFSDSQQAWRQAMEMARQQYEGFPGLTVLTEQDFGAQPGDLNPLGYKDSIGQPAIEGSGVDPLPGQGRAVKAGEFILGYPGEDGVPLPMPQPDVLGRNGTFAGLRKYQSRVATFNRFLREHAGTEPERELLAAKLVGRWRSGAPLTLAPARDDPELGADPRRNNDFTYAADPDGRQVPLGSHMRRMNPRDTKLAILTDVNIHRIIRRSTTYGAPYDPDAISPQDDETPPGALLHLPVRQGHGHPGIPAAGVDQQRQLHEPGLRTRPQRRPAGRGGHVHHPAGAGQAPHPRHRHLQRPARRRVLLPAVAIGAEMARKGALTHVVQFRTLLVLKNNPTFVANTARHYVVLQEVGNDSPKYLARGKTGFRELLTDLLTGRGTFEQSDWAWEEMFAYVKAAQLPIANPLLSTYWSMGSSRHGDYIAKTRIATVAGNAAHAIYRKLDLRTGPDVFGTVLADELRAGSFDFDLQVQLCTDLDAMPVNDTTTEWPEKLSPFITVGRVHIPRQDISRPENSEKGDALAFNQWRVTSDHRPLGEIMNVRRIYSASARMRRTLNHQPQGEPASADDVLPLPKLNG